jgi:NitT/TauT family transport system substrate-binding protein
MALRVAIRKLARNLLGRVQEQPRRFPMIRSTRLRGGIVAAGALLALTAFSGNASADEKITFLSSWKAQAEHGGYYQAVAKGYFKKYGLDVTIREGGPGVDSGQLIAAGAVDFAMGSNNDIALNLQKAGADVVAVMAGMQKIPQILMTHPGNGITKIEDMKGKPILMSTSAITTYWVFLKAKYGFDDSQIRKYTFNIAPFLVDKSAIQQGYLSSEPYFVKREAGFEPTVFLLADEGYQSYASLTLVPNEWIKNKPAAVKGFVDASIEGWYDYLYGDPAPGNALIKADNPDMPDDVIAYGIAKMKEYEIVDGGDAKKLGIGAMSDARWKEHFQVLVDAGIMPKDMDVTKAYTLDYVNKGYGMKSGS